VAFVDALRPHPAVAGLTQTRILLSEPGINIAERALALLRGAGFSAEQAAQLGGFLNAVVSLVIAEPGSHDVLGEDARDKERRARKAALLTLPPSEYPNVIDSADELTVCENDDAYYAQASTAGGGSTRAQRGIVRTGTPRIRAGVDTPAAPERGALRSTYRAPRAPGQARTTLVRPEPPIPQFSTVINDIYSP
jgi:hypothetical protein